MAPFRLILEPVNSEVPVFVKETLQQRAVSSCSDDFCISLNGQGWIWLVFNRTLFVWPYLENSGSSSVTCFTLSLPPSGLKYTPYSISVYGGDISENKVLAPGVVAVSPEGVVRHWQNAALATNYTQPTVDLDGQVTHSIVHISLLTSRESQIAYKASVKSWLVDVTSYRDGLLMLVAAGNEAVSQDIHFGLARTQHALAHWRTISELSKRAGKDDTSSEGILTVWKLVEIMSKRMFQKLLCMQCSNAFGWGLSPRSQKDWFLAVDLEGQSTEERKPARVMFQDTMALGEIIPAYKAIAQGAMYAFQISREEALCFMRLISPDFGRVQVSGSGVCVCFKEGLVFVHLPENLATKDRISEEDVYEMRYGERDKLLGFGGKFFLINQVL